MKKNILGILCCGVIVMITSCATTSKLNTKDVADNEQSRKVSNENNTDVNARKTVIVDWQDRTIGAKVNPEWLLSITRGNGSKYVETYGLTNTYANHKWFCSAAQDESLAVAQTVAQTDVAYNLASDMANTINATLGQTLNDGQKDAVRTICSKVNVTLNGVAERGSYWQLEKTEDEYGNVATVYNYYSLQSMSNAKYNELLQIYLVELLKSKDLDETSVNAIAANAQAILDNVAEQNERMEEAKQREYELQILHEQNELKKYISDNQTKQVQSANAATVDISNNSTSASIANHATMNPALAAIVKSRGF